MVTLKNIFTMNIAKNIYLCLTGAGVVIFMFYCMRIKFLPTGLTISDVIFFLMVVASFSLFLGFFLMYWYSMSVVANYIIMKSMLLTLKKKTRNARRLKGTYRMARLMKIYDPLFAHFIISIIGGGVLFLIISQGKIEALPVFESIFATTLCLMLIPHVYVDRRIKKENKKKHSISIIAMSIILFFIISDMPPLISDTGMGLIGVRKYNSTFLLQGNDLEMARHLTGDHQQTFFKGDAVFTGVGTTSLLIINNKKIIVNNENLTISF